MPDIKGLPIPSLRGVTTQIGAGTDLVLGYAGSGAGLMTKFISDQTEAISHRLEVWSAGETSTFKIISGDFRPGRAIISMDGLKLRNRGNALEIVSFADIVDIQTLITQKKANFLNQLSGAGIGSVIGGGAGAVGGLLSLRGISLMSGAGAAAGGALGAVFATKRHYQTCRVHLRDERRMIAVAENVNWMALMASLPSAKAEKKPMLRRLFSRG